MAATEITNDKLKAVYELILKIKNGEITEEEYGKRHDEIFKNHTLNTQ
jgi:uncharacterized membrane protein